MNKPTAQNALQEVSSGFQTLIQSVKDRQRSMERKEDSVDIFTKYLGTKLREIPQEKRFSVERKLLEIVQDHMQQE